MDDELPISANNYVMGDELHISANNSGMGDGLPISTINSSDKDDDLEYNSTGSNF